MGKLLASLFCFLFVLCSYADVNVYTDAPVSPFSDWGWGTKTASDTTQHHSGTASYSFQPAAYSAAFFEATGAVDLSLYSGVQFYIYFPTGANTNIAFNLVSYTSSSGQSSAVGPNNAITTYVGTITYGTWLKGTVNFASNGFPTTGKYDGVWWQDRSGGSSTVKVYIDDVTLIAKTSGSSAAASTSAKATTASSTSAKATTAAATSAASTSAKATTAATTAAASTSAKTSTSTTGSSSTSGGNSGPVCDSTTDGLFHKNTTGQATYYGAYTNGGHCSLDPTPAAGSSSSIFATVAIVTAIYGTSSTCGMCIEVYPTGTGSGGSPLSTTPKLVFVNNECPSCNSGGLDLGLSGDGVWDIKWQAVPCPVTSAVQFLLQGSNNYYLKLQVRNTKYPVCKLAAKSGSTYYQLTRTIDNFFEAPSNFPFPLVFPLSVQITASNGAVITDSVPSLTNGAVLNGSQQFS